jgi:hypothetical protein
MCEHSLQQAEGGLVGPGASASTLPGPITEGASYYTAPAATGTAPASGASSTPTPSSGGGGYGGGSSSGALGLSASSMLLTVSGAILGGMMVFA